MIRGIKEEYIIWKLLVSIILLSGNSFYCQAQLNATVLEEFTQAGVNPYLINPSAFDTSYKFIFRANNLNELGLIKNVSKFYFDVDKRINSPRQNGFHFVGLQAFNSKFGDYIYRSRLQIRYSWYTRISKHAALSSGISLGFINYSFLTTQGGTGGADYGPDGSIGIHYLRRKTTLGIAVQQLFTPILMPVNQSFKLDRLFNFDFSHLFFLSPAIDIRAHTVFQLAENGNYSFGLGFLSGVSDRVLLGLNNFSFSKTSVNAGIKNIRVFNSDLMLLITYSFHHNNIPVANNTLEIYLALQK